MSVALLLRPDLEMQRTWLTCRATIDAPLNGIKTDKWKNYARSELCSVRERFIHDMEHQGWRHIDSRPQVSGPFSHIDPRGIPGRPNMPKRKRGEPSVPLHKVDHVADRDYYTENVVPVAQHEQWDFEIKELFSRRYLVEVPDVGPKSEMSLNEYLKRSA